MSTLLWISPFPGILFVFIPTAIYRQSSHLRMNKAHALLFALMMMTVPLAECFGGDDGDSNDETPTETLDDWQVYFAASSSDLPECNDDNR